VIAVAPPHVEPIDVVMARVHRACLTVARLPGDGPRGFFSTWPAYRQSWWDWGNEESRLSDADIARRLLRPPPFVPTAQEIDDCLPALDLLRCVSRPMRIVVSAYAVQEWYALKGGWRAIGRAAGVSHTTARRLHWQATCIAVERAAAPSKF
jgi:hypothetical protein